MKLKHEPCRNCKRVVNMEITHFQFVSEDCYAVRFKCPLCGVIRFKTLTKKEKELYVSK